MEREKILAFGRLELDLEGYELRRDGVPVLIQRKPLDLLLYLARNEHRVVPKEELLLELWPGVTVSEHALTSALRDLRRAIGEDDARDMILTVRGRGLQLSRERRGSSVQPISFIAELAGPVAADSHDEADKDAIRVRLARLSVDCRELLKLASVVGQHIEPWLLCAACDRLLEDVLALFDEAVDALLLTAPGERIPSYAFAHDRVRETLHEDLPARMRRELHGRVALAIEGSGQAARWVDRLAVHYAETGDAEKTAHYSLAAGDRAREQLSFDDAVAHYGRAAESLDRAERPDAERICRLLLAQAEAAWGTAEPASIVQRRFGVVAERARALGSSELLARAAIGRTGHGVGVGDFRDIAYIDAIDTDLLKEANGALGVQPNALRVHVLARLALSVRYTEGLVAAAKLSNEAVDVARSLDDKTALASALRFQHEVLSGPGHAMRRTEIASELLSVARPLGSRPLELDALHFLARDHFELGEFERAREAGVLAKHLTQAMPQPGAQFRDSIRKILVMTLGGHFDTALEKAREYNERHGARNLSATGTFVIQIAMIHLLRGEHDRVVAVLEPEVRRRPISRWPELALARAELALGRAASARRSVDGMLREGAAAIPDDHSRLGCMMLLADLCVELRDAEAARLLYDQALPFESMIAAPFLATLCQGAIARSLGALSALLGREAASRGHFETALYIERRLGSRPLIAATLVAYGRALAARSKGDDRIRAAALLEEARLIATQFGMFGVRTDVVGIQRQVSAGLN